MADIMHVHYVQLLRNKKAMSGFATEQAAAGSFLALFAHGCAHVVLACRGARHYRERAFRASLCLGLVKYVCTTPFAQQPRDGRRHHHLLGFVSSRHFHIVDSFSITAASISVHATRAFDRARTGTKHFSSRSKQHRCSGSERVHLRSSK